MYEAAEIILYCPGTTVIRMCFHQALSGLYPYFNKRE